MSAFGRAEWLLGGRHLPGAQAMLLMAASLVIALVLCLQGHHYARKSRDMQARFEYLKRALSASNE